MTYNKQILALVLLCLSVLYNNRIEGTQFGEVEGGQNDDKEGRSNGVHHTRIISNLFSNLTNDQSSNYHIHHAGWQSPNHMFHGTRARISVCGIPDVSFNSASVVYIAVMNDNGKSYSMVAGFHGDNGKGCYSINCQGFVLSNVYGAPIPGNRVAPLSTFDGKDYFVTLSIKKDEKTQDWSLYRDDNNDPILIGWWPKALFNNTFDYATKIIWAAEVFYPKNETSPPMGSGHAACEGANKAAYISNIKVYDEFGQTSDPDIYIVKPFTDRRDCFTTDGFKYSRGKGYNFYHGGPAGCKN